MSSLISPGLTASARKAVSRTLPDECVITRSGSTFPCRVSDTTGNKHVEGMPRFISLPRWQLKFPVGADVQPWDEATVRDRGTGAVKGVYLITEDVTNQSWNFSSLVFGIASRPSLLAETLREPGPSSDTLSDDGATVWISRLTLRFLGDYLLIPVSQQWMTDTFGATAGGLYRLLANWPLAADFADPVNARDTFPVRPDDTIVFQTTEIAKVVQVQNFAPTFLALYVQLTEHGRRALSLDGGATLGGIQHETPGGDVLLAE